MAARGALLLPRLLRWYEAFPPVSAVEKRRRRAGSHVSTGGVFFIFIFPLLLFSQLSLILSDVKAQIGPSSLPPVYITELIKERMVIKKWWSGRGLWQEKLILFNKKRRRMVGGKRSYRRKLTEEKRLGNGGAKPRAVAFTIHFYGWLAQTPTILLRLWTWVFRYLFCNRWWHKIGLVFNAVAPLLCPT